MGKNIGSDEQVVFQVFFIKPEMSHPVAHVSWLINPRNEKKHHYITRLTKHNFLTLYN